MLPKMPLRRQSSPRSDPLLALIGGLFILVSSVCMGYLIGLMLATILGGPFYEEITP
jgi:hypothetical protein